MHDPEIKHWEIKTLVSVGPRWFRVNTIKLLNGKFETAIVDCNHEGKMSSMNIYFYNSHKDDAEATNFNKVVSEKMQDLNNKYNFNEDLDILNTIEENVKELSRYTKSVFYEYPKDLFGEEYR